MERKFTMKLYMSGNSPYARRARITAREAGLMDQVEEIPISGFEQLLELGPGGKIPVLVVDDGLTLSESLIITRYLNDLSGGGLLPAEAVEKGNCLALESVACVLMDSLFVRSMENNHREEESRSSAVLTKEGERCRRCYDALEKMVPQQGDSVSLASIAVISALGYSDWRAPTDEWRQGRPNLESYFDRLMERTAFSQTAPAF
jgi:glutathione S-transferase